MPLKQVFESDKPSKAKKVEDNIDERLLLKIIAEKLMADKKPKQKRVYKEEDKKALVERLAKAREKSIAVRKSKAEAKKKAAAEPPVQQQVNIPPPPVIAQAVKEPVKEMVADNAQDFQKAMNILQLQTKKIRHLEAQLHDKNAEPKKETAEQKQPWWINFN